MNNKPHKRAARLLSLILVVSIVMSPGLMGVANSQTGFRPALVADPANPSRKVLRLPKIMRRAPEVRLKTNVLESPQFRRAPVPFQKYELIHPVTKKPINPSLTVTLPNKRVVTVKQLYDEANKVEHQLSQLGYSLRAPNTFDNIKLTVNPRQLAALIPKGFARAQPGRTKKPVPVLVPRLYINAREGLGSQEFPTSWVKSVNPADRTDFIILLSAAKGHEQMFKKMVWQVSSSPFRNEGKPLEAKNIVVTGEGVPNWSFKHKSTSDLPGAATNSFARFDTSFPGWKMLNKEKIGPKYLRAVVLTADGRQYATDPVFINYGAKAPPVEIPFQEVLRTPFTGEKLAVGGPESNFGFYFEKNSLVGTVGKIAGRTTGYRVNGGAKVGVRYYNFEHLINSNLERSVTQEVLSARIEAVAGLGTGPSSTNETQGARLLLSFFGGKEEIIPLGDQTAIPKTEVAYSYKPAEESIDYEFFSITIALGPLAIIIKASLVGSYGLECGIRINVQTMKADGFLRAFLNSDLNVSGGLGFPVLPIFFAAIEAKFDPLFDANVGFNFGLDSGQQSIFASGGYNALVGGAAVRAGFYHPCEPVKQVKKIIGYIAGDSDLPLCETSWSFDIYKSTGVSESWEYAP